MSLRPLPAVNLQSGHTPVNQTTPRPYTTRSDGRLMDIWIAAAVVMLIVWGVATFALTAPGWVHMLLTAGVFVLIWRIVVRGTQVPGAPTPGAKQPGPK